MIQKTKAKKWIDIGISCFAIIDKELIWHGGVNLLGKVDVWDNLIRIKDIEVANELLELSFGLEKDTIK